MAIKEYRKVECDNCKKVEEIEGSGSYPSGWLQILIFEYRGNSGESRLEKEVCSDKCVLELLKKLKKIPPKPTVLR